MNRFQPMKMLHLDFHEEFSIWPWYHYDWKLLTATEYNSKLYAKRRLHEIAFHYSIDRDTNLNLSIIPTNYVISISIINDGKVCFRN